MKKVLKHTMSAFSAGGLLLVLYAMKGLFAFVRIQGYLRGEGKPFPQFAKCGGNEFLGRFFVFHLQPLYFFGGFCRKMADDAFCQYSGTLENDALRRMRVHFF